MYEGYKEEREAYTNLKNGEKKVRKTSYQICLDRDINASQIRLVELWQLVPIW
jgi:hypothetical protein